MKNRLLICTIILVIIVGLAFGYKTYNSNKKIEHQVEISEKITDDCTEEYEEMQKGVIEQANANNERITPSTKMILRKYYTKCNHTIDKEVELPQELVNKNIEELREEYSDWQVVEFSSDKIILSKSLDEQCGEHYMLRDNDGIIAIYEINDNGEESLLDETEIATEYLTESDLLNIKDGIEVNGIEELNKVLEDFE